MKELKFVHITKTGGTSISAKGKSIGLLWGSFHKEYGFWHECLGLKPKKIREKYDWFTSVRNPFDRVVSEFHCKWSRGSDIKEATENAIAYKNKSAFNDIIMMKLLKINKKGNHYTEQYRYFEHETDIAVIRFERLKKDFDLLMRKRKIPLVLNLKENTSKRTFEIYDLFPKTVNRIIEVYKKDFEKFEYSTKVEIAADQRFNYILP